MSQIKPLLKWAGGKRQLLPQIRTALPEEGWDHYFEPFLGGGAVLWSLTPPRATVNDLNGELITLYRVVRDHPAELKERLSSYPNEPEFFYSLRAVDRDVEAFAALGDVSRAARTIYLNRTCYNGLYRVNSAGQFNAPYGRYRNPTICDGTAIDAMSEYLNEADVTLLHGDYAAAVAHAGDGDFVYLDPPYDPVSVTSSFTGYAAGGFARQQQHELKALCDDLDSRGVRFLLSNSATEFIRELYADYRVEVVGATRAINSVASRRGKIDEVLVRNYD